MLMVFKKTPSIFKSFSHVLALMKNLRICEVTHVGKECVLGSEKMVYVFNSLRDESRG